MMNKRVIVVTGGSSGIGLETVKQLASDKNAKVISLSRNKERIIKAKGLLGENKNIAFFEGDITNIEDCNKLSKHIEENYGMLHGLVNNAGILTKGGIELIDYETWKYNLDVNLNGVYLFTRTLLPLLKKAQDASIVNVSSIASLKPGSSVAYSVSKAGLDMLTEFLAGDLAPYKIRVNSVNPGLVRTSIHISSGVIKNQEEYESMVNKAVERYPLGRIGQTEDIANLIIFLLSEKSSWITGAIIKADGGAMVHNELLPPK